MNGKLVVLWPSFLLWDSGCYLEDGLLMWQKERTLDDISNKICCKFHRTQLASQARAGWEDRSQVHSLRQHASQCQQFVTDSGAGCDHSVLIRSLQCFPSVSASVKNLLANAGDMWETCVRSLSREDPLEESMATHSSILPWRIPWTGEPDGL